MSPMIQGGRKSLIDERISDHTRPETTEMGEGRDLDDLPRSQKRAKTANSHVWFEYDGSDGAEPPKARRAGPLTEETRAKATVLRAVGACWRCRILKRPV